MSRLQTQHESDTLYNRIMEGRTPMGFGQFFGYPACCRWDMQLRMAAVQAGLPVPAIDESTLWIGTGYVPCAHCAKRPAVDVYREIMSARMCYFPFPFGEATDLHSNIKDGYQERIEVDVALLKHLENNGVELEPMQVQYLKDYQAVYSNTPR